jgi:hypothetical protein
MRFMKGGGAQEMMEDALIMVERIYRDRWKVENFSVSQVAFPSVHG